MARFLERRCQPTQLQSNLLSGIWLREQVGLAHHTRLLKIFGAGYDLLNQHKNRKGAQVTPKKPKEGKAKFNFKKFLNIKLRPKDAPKEAVIYVWGGLIASDLI